MRLVTFVDESTTQRAGVLIENGECVLDLQLAHETLLAERRPELNSVLELIEAGEPAMQLVRRLLARSPRPAVRQRDQIRLRAPLQPPPQMRNGSCFELHLRQYFESVRRARAVYTPKPEASLRNIDASVEMRALETFDRHPVYHKGNRFAVVGADDDVIWPAFSEQLDFELQFGCYIGRRAKDVRKEDASQYILGYTIFNDFSARDVQLRELSGMQGPAKSKDFDTANVMGPCLVTADEIEDPYDLTMIARVNGEEWGRGSTRDMRWRFDDVIAHVSRSETLYPGEFLGSGAVGNGSGLQRMRCLRPGDVVELEVEQLGVLRSRVVAAPALVEGGGLEGRV